MKLIEKWVDDNEGGRFRTSVIVVLTSADLEVLRESGRVDRPPQDSRFDSKLAVVVAGQNR